MIDLDKSIKAACGTYVMIAYKDGTCIFPYHNMWILNIKNMIEINNLEGEKEGMGDTGI